LDINTKHLEVLVCYDFVNRFKNEEENTLLATKPDLFTINTITLPEVEILVIVLINVNIDIDAKIDTMQKLILTWKSKQIPKSIPIPKLILI
jgi:hypothetical protein